ncbi:MAG: CRISPR-associated endonuclease Cas2 [Longimicrobiales bacterium]
MARRHYLVTYDISDDKRRNQVFRTLHGFGDHAQYSVFFCEMNREELARLRQRLRAAIHQGEDQVLIVELGTAARPVQAGLEVLGRHYEPPVRTIVV